MSGPVKQAQVIAAIGATGSGKSAWVKQGLKSKPPKRLVIWDPQGEYSEFGRSFTDLRQLHAAVIAGCGPKAQGFRVVFRPGDVRATYASRFDWLCRLVYAVGDLTFVVEELADLTEPSRSPDSWSVLCRKGRHKRLRIVAASQRPASVDKDFFSNCSFIHCGRLNYDRDVSVMGNVLGCKPADVAALKNLEWIERDMLTGAVRRGALSF